MKPFAAASVDPEGVERGVAAARQYARNNGLDVETAGEAAREELEGATYFRNDQYQVAMRGHAAPGWPAMIWLSIKRLDKEPIHDWRELQEIKNELVGPEHEGVELYPAESRLVDSANQYHLWVLASADSRFPFGFKDRAVSEDSINGSKQRPFKGGGARGEGAEAGAG